MHMMSLSESKIAADLMASEHIFFSIDIVHLGCIPFSDTPLNIILLVN